MIIKRLISTGCRVSTKESIKLSKNETFRADSFTNVTPKIISYLDRKLYTQKEHPLCLLKERIIQFFYKKFVGRRGNPIFSVHDALNPIVTVKQNFDALLVPENHPSRSKTDCYYINKELLLRAHMTAHQPDLIKMGFDNFLMVGDVYRRDNVDSTHYPVFHQLDGVRLFTPSQLFTDKVDEEHNLRIKESAGIGRTKEKQECYTLESTLLVETELKTTLEMLTKDLFGSSIEYKWVDAYFPFTHPSWELEILLEGNWVEMLGCGIMENRILEDAGCGERIGWAFGLGLERLAMMYYSIPDIRMFWSTDSGFLCQFTGKTCMDRFKFKPVSVYPPIVFDISFWITEDFNHNDFYELTREVCGDIVEQVQQIDHYNCKKTGRESYSFRVTYRSMFKTLLKTEVREIHSELEKKAVEKFKVIIR